MNLFFQLTLGMRVQERYGALRFALLFLISGICGNLLSDAFSKNGVGASTACFGLIGAEVAGVLLAWPYAADEWKSETFKRLGTMFLMIFMWEAMNWKTIGHFGHLGGFISGLLMGMIL